MFLYLGGCLDAPYICMPAYVCTPPYISMPRVYRPPTCSPYSSVHLCSQRLLHVVGGCKGLLFVLGHFPYTTPIWGCLPFICTPHNQLLVPCALVCFMDICMSCGHFPFCWGFGGVPPSFGGFWGTSALVMSICSFLYIFVVNFVSLFSYGYDYYSSSYGSIFRPVISLISDSGSFPHRVSSKLGQHGVVHPPPLMPRGSGGVIGSISVPQQQTPSLMPLLAYANYAMGSPQVGFFFRVEPPTVLYIICLVSILVSAFYF